VQWPAPVSAGEAVAMSADWARPVVHWEIEARDAEAQRAFYARLFNWDIGDGPIMAIAPGLGGPEPGPAGHLRAGDQPGVRLYVQVRDLRASLALAEELGATLLGEPFDIPGGATLAPILDPEDNPVMLVQQ
jgi:predicted enzyme related to lactoylglutathione lyase